MVETLKVQLGLELDFFLLLEDCLKLTGKKSGVVLDPFIGTGTTAVAAVNLGWEYIGYDIDQDYIEFAKSRLGL